MAGVPATTAHGAPADLAGGWELRDQGVHAIDLFRWFLGEVADVSGRVATYLWDAAPLEASTLALRASPGDRFANCMSVEHSGGSYGEETLGVGAASPPELSPRGRVLLGYPGEDLSWNAEWSEFVSAIREARQALANGEDGLRALQLVGAIDESFRSSRAIQLEFG